jgi:hypothetical protein
MSDPRAAKSDPSAAADDLFNTPVDETPRVKRRSLQTPAPAAPRVGSGEARAPRETAREAAPAASKPETVSPAPAAPRAEKTPASSSTAPAAGTAGYRPIYASTAQPSTPAQAAPGTSGAPPRPGTLYYSTGPRQEKKETPMSIPPTASPSHAAATSMTSRPAPTRAPSALDYRANIDRQAREQHSVGSFLAIVVYSLLGLFVLGACLAGYGTWALSKQIHQQSLTIGDLDRHYSDEDDLLKSRIKTVSQDLAQADALAGRQQQIIEQQQATITKLSALTEQLAANLQAERQVRSIETTTLRARVRSLENERIAH